MKQKLTDTSMQAGHQGRVERYWKGKNLKSKKGDFVGSRPLHDPDEIKVEDVLREYHLAGFEFGNWETQNDRWDNLRACKSALEDLSGILKTKNIGFDHHIYIAFGARGMGGKAAAHYEPGHNAINLTKTNGDNSLAHEYGHAIDYNFGSFIDQHPRYAALSGGWSTEIKRDNIGGHLRNMVNQIVNQIRSTESFQFVDDGDYWSRSTEIFARFFEQYIAYKLSLKSQYNYYLTKPLDFYYKHCRSGYLSEKELQAVVGKGDALVSYLRAFYEGEGTLRKVGFPPIQAVAKAPIKNPKYNKKFFRHDNVAEFPEDIKNRKKLAQKFDYEIGRFVFTDEFMKTLSYQLLPAAAKAKGWIYYIAFPGRKLYRVTSGGVDSVIENMRGNTFVFFYKPTKTDQKNIAQKAAKELKPASKPMKAAASRTKPMR